jgi:hypothetical protein
MKTTGMLRIPVPPGRKVFYRGYRGHRKYDDVFAGKVFFRGRANNPAKRQYNGHLWPDLIASRDILDYPPPLKRMQFMDLDSKLRLYEPFSLTYVRLSDIVKNIGYVDNIR